MANHPLRGESDLDDATRGDIHTKAKNGIVGTNSDVSGPAPAGSAGGNGVFGFSKVPSASGVFGSHDGFGAGVSGFSIDGSGLAGVSTNGDAARGDTHAGAKANGLVGTNDGIGPVLAGQPGGNGVFGFSKVPDASASGVAGGHDGVGNGVTGFSQAGSGVAGVSTGGDGTRGDTHTKAKNGIVGTNSDVSGPAPAGSAGGNGVFGFSKVPSASGVFGSHDGFGAGVSGFSIDGSGLAGVSTNGDAARGHTHAGAKANGLVGTNDGIGPVLAGQPGGNGVFGFSKVPDASASGVAGGHDGVGNGVTGFSQAGSGVSGVS